MHRFPGRPLLLIGLALILLSTAAVPAPLSGIEALPTLGGGGDSAAVPGADFTLHIPAIGLDVPVLEAEIRGSTWDFSGFTRQAAHLQLTYYPGQGSNIVIGAHYELTNFAPGPFYHLDRLAVGDQITLHFEGQTYTYEVRETLLVTPTDISVIYRTPQETLTLLTCYSYNRTSGRYARRYVVRAVRVA